MNKNVILSPRESQIAELLAWGAAKKEVADMLNISTRTVENFCKIIYLKIGIQKATELSVWWFTTHCGVSMDLSPFKRKMGALALFLLMLPTVFGQTNNEIARYRCSRSQTQRIMARGNNQDEVIDFFNI